MNLLLAHAEATSPGFIDYAEWTLAIVVSIVAIVAYQRFTAPPDGQRRSARSTRRLLYWEIAIVSIAVMQLPPMAVWVDQRFTAHMVQHIVFVFLTAPLIVLARPVAAVGAELRRRGWDDHRFDRLRKLTRWLYSPTVCWAAVVGFIWVVHFSPIYDLAIRNDAVHMAQHFGFIAAGILAWVPILGPRHTSLPDPLAVLYVFVLMPALTFCGVALFSANRVLYESYSHQSSALRDQRFGAMIMWVLPSLALLPLLLGLVVRWWNREERAAALLERTK